MNCYHLSELNCEGPPYAEGIIHNPSPCFGIAFVQLGVIPRTRINFDETVAVAECYLIKNHVKNKESKKQPFQICLSVKLADRKMSMEKENISSYLIYNILNFCKMAGKPFFTKVS